MNFDPDPGAEAFRVEVDAFFAEHVTGAVIERAHTTGTLHDWGLHRALAERGWLAAGWPVEYGGQARSVQELAVLDDAVARTGAPVDGWGTSDLVAQTLAIVGSEEQKRSIIPLVLSGEVVICLGYSERDSGSDVAAAKTEAVRDGDEWRINGSKMFTTLAQEASYVFLLTRTNRDVPKHRGLTMFVVPMDAVGVEIRAIETLGGERTNVTFYNDVRVADTARVGAVDAGWDVMKVALAFERRPTAHGSAVRLLAQVEQWVRSAIDGSGRPLIEDPSVRERLARVAVDNAVGEMLKERMSWVTQCGGLPVVEGSMAKLWTSEALQRASGEFLDALGPEGVLQHGEDGAPVEGWVEQAWRHATATTIYAGTSEIQRSIIAERRLGLPRGRPPG